MYELHEARYQMILRGQGDVWALHGHVHNHPKFEPHHYIAISTPVEFDPETNVVTTKSGSEYKLVDGFDPAIIEQLTQDIDNGGYEIH